MSGPTPSSPDEDYKEASFTEDGVDADADDDDDEPSSWKRLGMSKLFGKKKTIRRKKYTKTASGDADIDIDSSIATDVCRDVKQRRPPRQRAKASMYPPKNSDSELSDGRGLDPMDAPMEAALPLHSRQTQRKQHKSVRLPDPPTGGAATHHKRWHRKGSGDGYEASGNETSDFCGMTEDEKSDFYLVTEDDRDIDEGEEEDGDDHESKLLDSLGAATQRLSLASGDSKNCAPGAEGEGPGEENQTPAAEEKPQSQKNETPQHSATPSSPTKSLRKKQRQRRRTAKSKKAPEAALEDTAKSTQEQEVQHQGHLGEQKSSQGEREGDEGQLPTKEAETLSSSKKGKKKRGNRKRSSKKGAQNAQQQEGNLTAMQEEEELDCHTPMKEQMQPTPKRSHQTKSSQQNQTIDEKEEEMHEDLDDYPSNMGTPAKEGSEAKETEKTLEEELTFLKMSHQKPKRTLEEELSFLKRISPTRYQVQLGFVPNMKVPAEIIVNNDLQTLLVQELQDSCCGPKAQAGGFIPALRQAANVAALPGIVRASLAMPDVHSGYGFCIGNVAAFDMDDPLAVISPGGVGFDINCGVRLIRTNLTEADVGEDVREELAEAMFRNIPVGVGAGGDIPCNMEELNNLLGEGVNWAIRKGFAWPEDREHCEENGRMETADPKCVSHRAKKRGLKQLGTLGAGNHYAEIQVVDEIFDPEAAQTMGIGQVGQVCIMIHTGSRGLGHQVATDALTVMERAMARDNIDLNDRQLSCARINSREGKEYLAGMSAAANFAWVNRSCITFLARKAFSEVFDRTPEDMDMHLLYDVCHNIAKVERHAIDGVEKTLLVHRKGSTRAFPPKHPNIPKDYQSIGQPVLIGGTMGTCSYVLVGTEKGMAQTFGSTCHGAGRALSRNQSRKTLDHNQVLEQLHKSGISIRVASPKLVTEEAPESYKNVCDVIDTCQDAGISKKVVKLRPIAVIKG